MGKRSRDKGARVERKMVDWFESIGIKAQRVPLSGGMKMRNSLGEEFKDDLSCSLNGWLFRTEVKARAGAKGWQTIKKWLGEADMLALIEDRTDPLMVIPWHIFTELIAKIVPEGLTDIFGGADSDGGSEAGLSDDEQGASGDPDGVVPPI